MVWFSTVTAPFYILNNGSQASKFLPFFLFFNNHHANGVECSLVVAWLCASLILVMVSIFLRLSFDTVFCELCSTCFLPARARSASVRKKLRYGGQPLLRGGGKWLRELMGWEGRRRTFPLGSSTHPLSGGPCVGVLLREICARGACDGPASKNRISDLHLGHSGTINGFQTAL